MILRNEDVLSWFYWQRMKINKGVIERALAIVTSLVGFKATKRHKRNIKIAAKNDVNSIVKAFGQVWLKYYL